MATLKDLLDSGMSREEINALLSQGTVGTEGFDPSTFNSERANPNSYMPPPQQAPLPQNYIQNERTGRVIDMGQSQPAGPAMDYSSPIEIGGYGKGYRLKGDATRAVLANGQIVSMGRDTGSERARMKEDLGLDAQRANIAQTNLENKIKQTAINEDASLKAGNAMTAKQYEARHGRIPSGFEIYQTETGETDIRPVQGGKQYLELQDRVHKFDSSGKGMDEYGTQLDKLTNHPGRESATGFSSITNPLALSGGDAKDFLNELETFQSQAFLSNIDKLRGTGPLSNVEGEKLQAAVGNLNVSSNEETFKKNLMDVKRRFESLKEKAKIDADNARGEMKREKPKLTSVDGEAIAWAMKNPTDPRAAAIKARLGVR
jgi:hypothetical protein